MTLSKLFNNICLTCRHWMGGAQLRPAHCRLTFPRGGFKPWWHSCEEWESKEKEKTTKEIFDEFTRKDKP